MNQAMVEVICDALRFAAWAAGEGIGPQAGEPAKAPEDFLSKFSRRTGHEDWDQLPELILFALNRMSGPCIHTFIVASDGKSAFCQKCGISPALAQPVRETSQARKDISKTGKDFPKSATEDAQSGNVSWTFPPQGDAS
jgi:hypothetical protein